MECRLRFESGRGNHRNGVTKLPALESWARANAPIEKSWPEGVKDITGEKRFRRAEAIFRDPFLCAEVYLHQTKRRGTFGNSSVAEKVPASLQGS
jgi:hypothetical protein